MATIKSYTDLSQSKKLAEILPIETADQTWERIAICGTNFNVPEGLQYRHNGDMLFSFYSGIGIPCWSLAALLSVIPKKIKDFNVLRIDINEKDFSIWYGSIRYDEIGYGMNTKLPDITMKCLVDACYEMIIRLHKLNLL